ncbi:MAG: putative PurR-regulated permease PerM [Ilumatobacter sp.]|jgi:predicted PurR-regulated permease PerM
MSVPMTNPANRSPRAADPVLVRWGRASWLLLGILAVATVSYSALAAMSGLVVPLVIATVIGMLASPLVDILERRKVPRGVGALLVLLGIVAAIIGSAMTAINGMVDQGDEISRQLTAGLQSIDGWLQGFDVDAGVAADRLDQAKQFGVDLIPGLAGWFTTAFSGVISFFAGCFLGLFLLYFILADWARVRDWVGSHLGVPQDLGRDVVDDATAVIRQGFSALTVSSFTTAVIIGATMVVLDIPLAFPVALVTFMTSYIPYLGAIFSAIFAFLVALGSAGLSEALILLVVILVVQNVVQTVMTTKLTSDKLSIHPIANIVSTIVGAAIAGLLGATLSAPLLAMAIRITRRVRDYQPIAGTPAGDEQSASS